MNIIIYTFSSFIKVEEYNRVNYRNYEFYLQKPLITLKKKHKSIKRKSFPDRASVISV